MIPSYFIQRHEPPEPALFLCFVESGKECVLRPVGFQKRMCSGDIRDAYGVIGTDAPAYIAALAISLDMRGILTEINSVHGTIIDAEGALGINALFHVKDVFCFGSVVACYSVVSAGLFTQGMSTMQTGLFYQNL